MTIKDLLKLNIFNGLEAEILLAFLLSTSKEDIASHPEKEITTKIANKFKRLVKKRKRNYPLAYILGYKDFYNLNLKVNKHVLVPRPETETMIDFLLEYTRKNKHSNFNFLDIGTGSGAIIIALAKNLEENIYLNSNFLATDISSRALKIANYNLKKYNLTSKIKLQKSDLLKHVKLSYFNTSSKLIITANLPYLTPQETKSEPSISREPKLALQAGKDGLKLYKRLFKMIHSKNLNNFILICEINPHQENSIKSLQKNYLKDINIKTKILKDLSGLTRFLIIEK
jgi:release factor glutamine methyltransferase